MSAARLKQRKLAARFGRMWDFDAFLRTVGVTLHPWQRAVLRMLHEMEHGMEQVSQRFAFPVRWPG